MPAILEKWSFYCDLNSNSQVWSFALGGQTGFLAQQAGEDDDEVCEAWSDMQVVHCLETPPSGHKHSISSQKTELESKNGQVCGGYRQILFYWEFPWIPHRHQRGLSSYLRWTKYSDMYIGRSCQVIISCQVIAVLTERKTKQQLRIVMVGRRWLSRSTNWAQHSAVRGFTGLLLGSLRKPKWARRRASDELVASRMAAAAAAVWLSEQCVAQKCFELCSSLVKCSIMTLFRDLVLVIFYNSWVPPVGRAWRPLTVPYLLFSARNVFMRAGTLARSPWIFYYPTKHRNIHIAIAIFLLRVVHLHSRQVLLWWILCLLFLPNQWPELCWRHIFGTTAEEVLIVPAWY